VREESHLDEMRDAIRGDFERLAARRGEQELMRVVDDDAPKETPEEPAAEKEPEIAVALEPAAPESDPEPEPERRSWLSRMFSA
jgi:hypothetical protein